MQPPLLVPTQVAATLSKKSIASPVVLAASTVRVLSEQLHDLNKNPEPQCQVFCEDLSFWCAVFSGASGTPYEGRCFLLYLDLSSFPEVAPEVRFVTPVFHLNVNSDGRICLDSLSSWSDKTSVRDILREIVKIMASPNPNSPLDSVKGSLFLENKQSYLAQAREKAQQHGKSSPKDFFGK